MEDTILFTPTKEKIIRKKRGRKRKRTKEKKRRNKGKEDNFNLKMNFNKLKEIAFISNKNIERPTIKCLLGEDNEANRKMLSVFLNRKNYSVDEARTGIEILDKLRNNHYDFIIMDIHMPFMDGIDVAKIIKQKKLTIPIIMITGDTSERTLEECKQIGIKRILFKPLSYREMYRIIEKVLGEKC